MTNTSSSANLYPFVTKNMLKARLEAEPAFRREVMVILFGLQTAHEQDTSSTLTRNKAGFMSSHAAHGCRIARRLIAGEEISGEDQTRIDTIAPRYTRQLACYYREQAIAANPALKAVAGMFSAD